MTRGRLLADVDEHPYGRHALPALHGSPRDVYRLISRETHHSYPLPTESYVGRHRPAEEAVA